jgi:uncharacterized membrane protein
MSLFLALKVLHVVGATVLLGTGAGIAFFMVMAHRTGDPRLIAHTAGVVVVADGLFTATAVILQPLTGAGLAYLAGYPVLSGWVAAALALYVIVGAFWLPVVWMQLRMRNLARDAVLKGAALDPAYHRLFRAWFACGFPAFAGVIGIIWLMVAKPVL